MKKLLTMLLACLGITASAQTNVQPGLPIHRYPRVTAMDAPDIFIIARTNISPATNMGVTYLLLSNNIAASLATTSYVNAATQNLGGFTAYETLTNGVRVALGTNVNWVSGVTGLVSGTSLTLGVNVASVTNTLATTNFVLNAVTNLAGSTNFINLSVQAAKLPNLAYPTIDAGWQTWELLYYRTNDLGVQTNLSASWQFVMPADYATNSLNVRILSTIQSTNGPNASNVVFMASVNRFAPDGTQDTHTNFFGSIVKGTNVWAASDTGTNVIKTLMIPLGTNSLLNAGDLAVLKIARDAMTNDTYVGATAVVGLQLEYTRK